MGRQHLVEVRLGMFVVARFEEFFQIPARDIKKETAQWPS